MSDRESRYDRDNRKKKSSRSRHRSHRDRSRSRSRSPLCKDADPLQNTLSAILTRLNQLESDHNKPAITSPEYELPAVISNVLRCSDSEINSSVVRNTEFPANTSASKSNNECDR